MKRLLLGCLTGCILLAISLATMNVATDGQTHWILRTLVGMGGLLFALLACIVFVVTIEESDAP